MPSVAFVYRRHARPVLHFFEGTAAAFAHFVALTGRADGDARCVWRGLVPCQPRRHGFGRETVSRCRVLPVKHHQRIHLSQGPQLFAQGNAVIRRTFLAPKIDGCFNIGDVQSGVHGYILKEGKLTKTCIKNQLFSSYSKNLVTSLHETYS